MKTLINLIGIALLIMSSASCGDEMVEGPEKVENTSLNESSKVEFGIRIKAGCTIARAIEVRPRDGETCGCSACFGLCDCYFGIMPTVSFLELMDDVEWEAGESLPIILDIDRSGVVRLYIESRVHWSESEFGVDEPLIFDSTAYPDLEVQSITINVGVYDFVSRPGQFELSPGFFYNFQGYVDLDADIVD